jgi:hypothetical protein
VPEERWLTAATTRLAHWRRPRCSLGALTPPFHAAMTCSEGSRSAQWPLWNRYPGNPGSYVTPCRKGLPRGAQKYTMSD